MMASTIRFPADLKAEATAYAEALGISLNALCAVALRDYMDSRKAARTSVRAGLRPSVTLGGVPAQAAARAAPARAVQGPTGTASVPRVGANQPCPCGSGQKYKRCHGKSVAA